MPQKLNGATETRVLVRYDLAEADAATIEKVFLDANVNRRHMDKLSIARVAYRAIKSKTNYRAEAVEATV